MTLPDSENPPLANANSKKLGNPNWQKGVSGNPKGKPITGFQGFKDRLQHWLETKTVGEIEMLVTNPKKWKKLVSVDAMVARRIHQACGADGTGDFIAILDRLLGKPAQTAEINVTHGLADRLDRAEAILLESKPVIDAEHLQVTSEVLVSAVVDDE